MKRRISVIVLNWDGRKWLKDCLSSILAQDVDKSFEVLLVDNGSTDGSVAFVRDHFPLVKLVELGKNFGFAEGNNRGLEYAVGDYLVFVNMDTKAESGWLKSLVDAADKHPEYQLLCSVQTPSQEKNRVRTLNAYGGVTCSPYESAGKLTDSLFASGACFLIKRKWLEKLGYLFDSFYFCSGEDKELSLRTILQGGRIGYVRDSRIYHYGGGADFPSFRMASLASRNSLLTYYKLFLPKNFARIFVVEVLYVVLRLLVRFKQFKTTLGALKGVVDFFFSFPRYKEYRKQFLKIKRREDKYVFERLLYTRKFEKKFLENIVYRC